MRLDDILTERQRGHCRTYLDLKGTLPFAERGGRIVIWRERDLKYKWIQEYDTSTRHGQGFKLPEELQKLCERDGTDK